MISDGLRGASGQSSSLQGKGHHTLVAYKIVAVLTRAANTDNKLTLHVHGHSVTSTSF